jgi:hypothetical protein
MAAAQRDVCGQRSDRRPFIALVAAPSGPASWRFLLQGPRPTVQKIGEAQAFERNL